MGKRYYKQCSLQKGNVYTLTYLPEKYAILGKQLKLRDENEVWEGGWIVMSVGERRDGEYLEVMDNLWKCSTKLTERGRK